MSFGIRELQGTARGAQLKVCGLGCEARKLFPKALRVSHLHVQAKKTSVLTHARMCVPIAASHAVTRTRLSDYHLL